MKSAFQEGGIGSRDETEDRPLVETVAERPKSWSNSGRSPW
jgi:hypothetical protein